MLALGEPWFCLGEACEVVYFDASGLVVTKDALRVQVFQKERDPERLVCYCFRHSVRDVEAAEAEAEAEGGNRVVEAITAACRSGLDRCEQMNPQGRCCLGNIRRVAKLASSEESCKTCNCR